MRRMEPENSDSSDERQQQLIETLARRIEAMGLSTPAILMLEATRPLSFLGSQAIVMLQPLLSLIFDQTAGNDYAALLEDPRYVERLVQRLERQADHSAQSTH